MNKVSDDMYIAITVIDCDVLVATYSHVPYDQPYTFKENGMHWLLEDMEEYSVADWVYYDPMEWGIRQATTRYGMVEVNGKMSSILDWEKKEIDGYPVAWAIRDADMYDNLIREGELI